MRTLSAIVGCDIHPVKNRRILETLRPDFGADEAAVNRWCTNWITAGFDAIPGWLSARGPDGLDLDRDAPARVADESELFVPYWKSAFGDQQE